MANSNCPILDPVSGKALQLSKLKFGMATYLMGHIYSQMQHNLSPKLPTS